MKTRLSPSAVGLFVLGALLLAAVAFLSFGGSNVFAKPSRFAIYFDESVSGLELGAAVKLTGVRIGRVAAINIRYDAAARTGLVQAVCEVDRNILTDVRGAMIDLSDAARFQDLIDRGLRARLNFQGITGLLFVDLSFEDPKKYPADPGRMNEPLPVVPAIPSAISEVQASVIEIVANLKKVDFPGLGKELKALLATANAKAAELDLKGLGERVGRAADAVEALASSPEAKQTFANLNRAIEQARAAMAKIEAQTGPVGDDLRQTLADAQGALKTLNDTAAATREFVQAQGGVGAEISDALRKLTDAAAAIERLAEFLERNPNALVVGKKRPEQERGRSP